MLLLMGSLVVGEVDEAVKKLSVNYRIGFIKKTRKISLGISSETP